jgi:hypothetical protein
MVGIFFVITHNYNRNITIGQMDGGGGGEKSKLIIRGSRRKGRENEALRSLGREEK